VLHDPLTFLETRRESKLIPDFLGCCAV